MYERMSITDFKTSHPHNLEYSLSRLHGLGLPIAKLTKKGSDLIEVRLVHCHLQQIDCPCPPCQNLKWYDAIEDRLTVPQNMKDISKAIRRDERLHSIDDEYHEHVAYGAGEEVVVV